MVGHTYRILVVDDDTYSLEVIGEVLNREGYQTFSAANGHQALKIIRENPIDLAVLDYNLPDIIGLELLAQIKQKYSGVPIIIMSANTSQNVKLDVFEAGAYTFIPKPIDLPQFLQFVNNALNFKQQWESGSQTRTHTIQIKKSIFFRWIRFK